MAIKNGTPGNDVYTINSDEETIVEQANAGTDSVNSSISYALPDNVENLTLTGANSYQTSSGTTVYGNPIEWGKYLDYYQGDNAQKLLGSCLRVAFDNLFTQIGFFEPRDDYSPSKKKIDYLETFMINVFDEETAVNKRIYSEISKYVSPLFQDISAVEASSKLTNATLSIGQIAEKVKDNYCVMITCDAGVLWEFYPNFQEMNHAVLVTGVEYSGSIVRGFYICDSGRQLKSDASRFVSYDLLNQALYYDGININSVVSTNPLKQHLDNINGTGNALDNSLTGNSGNNIIYGLGGNDTINGAGGADTLYGGQGSDTYIINERDLVVENSDEGNDVIKINTENDYHIPDNVEEVTIIASNGVKIYGNSEGNDIFGGNGADTIYGYDGNDWINGVFGDNVLIGGKGDDIYVYNAIDSKIKIVENADEGVDLVISYFSYDMESNIESLWLWDDTTPDANNNISAKGNSLDNEIFGNSGNNNIQGLGGADTLYGGEGNDTLVGAEGDDTYRFAIGNGVDTVIEENSYWKQGWCFLVPQEDTIELVGDEITKDKVILRKNNDDLEIYYGNDETDKIIVKNQLGNCLTRVEKLVLDDGHFLTDNSISDIIQKMSTYIASHQELGPVSYNTIKNNTDLMNIISTAWTSA